MALLTKDDKVRMVRDETGVTWEVATQYLEAEEWNVFDAVVSIRVDRKGGLLKD